MCLFDVFLDHCRHGDMAGVQRGACKLHPRWLQLGFRNACAGGHLHVAQWLVRQKGVSLLDCAVDTAFWWACAGGHLHVATWLLDHGHVAVHRDLDMAFLDACRNGHVHVARWLLGLDAGYEAWPPRGLRCLKVWSPVRDAWMRAVANTR